MLSNWTYSQKAWLALLVFTSTPNFIKYMLFADTTKDIIAYGTMFVLFFALSMLGGWYLGKHIRWNPRKP